MKEFNQQAAIRYQKRQAKRFEFDERVNRAWHRVLNWWDAEGVLPMCRRIGIKVLCLLVVGIGVILYHAHR